MAVKKKMNVIFRDEEEYQKFKDGKIHSDKGLRTEDGKLSSLPDIEEIEEKTYDYTTESISEKEEMGIGETILYAILEGLYEGVREFLSDEQNRAAITALAMNWWKGKALPRFKQGWQDIKEFTYGLKTGETKAERRLKERGKSTALITSKTSEITLYEGEENRKAVSQEEYQKQIDQIKMLAMLLADRIKKLSNSCIDPDKITEEEYLLQQSEIKKLTASEVMNSIRLLVEHDSFSLDDSTVKMFLEFIAGNLIVNGNIIPIEKIKKNGNIELI